uniref:Heat-and acid-stable phosphoprotein n=1 Tax=Schistosoma japonicum TaxID=6182 RepID=C1LI50_SCHJA|nr:heat-and acid-stable phosphoprotein [Schistosoma japonicum]CAX74379.1 heat-and acid-stable phosphoprotein [Schistosoma japonicum]
MRGKRIHKGRTRKFTAPEEIDRQLGLPPRGEVESIQDNNINDSETDDDEYEEEEDTAERHKGVGHLIEVCNPNHMKSSNAVVPSKKEVSASIKATTDATKLLSDTELAVNMARLQLVRKERELAAQKLEKEKQAREAQRAAAAATKLTMQSKSLHSAKQPHQKGSRSGKQTNSNKHQQAPTNQSNNTDSSVVTTDE